MTTTTLRFDSHTGRPLWPAQIERRERLKRRRAAMLQFARGVFGAAGIVAVFVIGGTVVHQFIAANSSRHDSAPVIAERPASEVVSGAGHHFVNADGAER